MGLWDTFGMCSQDENLIPNIPNTPTIPHATAKKGNSGDYGDIGEECSNLKKREGRGGTIPPSHPWPVLHELNERYQVGALPAEDGSGLVLYPVAGLLLSEKEAALRYAKDNLDALLHDLALEHLPRQVWLDGWRIAPDRRNARQERSKREAWDERTEQQAEGTGCDRIL